MSKPKQKPWSDQVMQSPLRHLPDELLAHLEQHGDHVDAMAFVHVTTALDKLLRHSAVRHSKVFRAVVFQLICCSFEFKVGDDEDAFFRPIEQLMRSGATSALEKINEKKALARLQAQELALDLWEQDREHSIRVGEMCQMVWAKMLGTEHQGQLPNDIDGLRDWIKDSAPAYAQAGGRPRTKKPSST